MIPVENVMLLHDEGRVYKAYPDPLTGGDPWTIGIGHTGPEVHAGVVWDDNQIDFAFQLDVSKAWQDCVDHFSPWFGSLNEARQAVLVCMAFQMGVSHLLGFKNTLKAVQEGRFSDAADGMTGSVWGHQTPLRAIRMAQQMKTGVLYGP